MIPQIQNTLQKASTTEIWTIQGPETNLTGNIPIVTTTTNEDS